MPLAPESLRLLAQELRRLGFAKWERVLESPVDSYNGDLIEGGRGELLVRAA